MSIGPQGGISTRQPGWGGSNVATNTQGGVTLLNNKGVDATGTKHLTAGERFAMRSDGFTKAKTNFGDQVHRYQASQANQKAKETYSKAAANGNITRFEQTGINQANRKANIANKQVNLDGERRQLGRMEKNFAADGRITPYEQRSLDGQKGKIDNMGRELNQLKAQDSRLTRRENRTLNNPFAKMHSNFQDKVGIGRKTFQPMTPPRPSCVPQQGQSRVGHPRLHMPGQFRTQHLGFGQRLGMMHNGAQKAQFKPSDAAHQFQATQAQGRLNNMYGSAAADGRITRFEQRDIAGAQRDVNIANKQVEYDGARRQLGTMERNFAADGRLTYGERQQLGAARGNLGRLGSELANLRQQDRQMDGADAQYKANPFNQFMNNVEGGSYRPSMPQWQPMPYQPPFAAASAAANINTGFQAGYQAGLAAGSAGTFAAGAAGFAAGAASTSFVGAAVSATASVVTSAIARPPIPFLPLPLPLPLPPLPFGGAIAKALGGIFG